jgi:nucleoside-diphosphate-sugar epimerase
VILVAGAGGAIGGHLVGLLLKEGFEVRAVDCKPFTEWWQRHEGAENLTADLRDEVLTDRAVAGCTQVYDLAADMGGIAFIEANKAACMLSIEMGINLLRSSVNHDVERFFFSSSACVYNADKQSATDVLALKEEDAYPAMPEDGYGWEKLYMERLCTAFRNDYGLETRIARYHNVYGPHGTWQGGREKAPAAICRKVAENKLLGQDEIEIWGDGEQTRSFMYVGDCVKGSTFIADSDYAEPLNLGSDRLVTVNQLVDIVEKIAEVRLKREYVLDAPQGVRGRNSDNTRLRQVTSWVPSVSLETGLRATYQWIYEQLAGE